MNPIFIAFALILIIPGLFTQSKSDHDSWNKKQNEEAALVYQHNLKLKEEAEKKDKKIIKRPAVLDGSYVSNGFDSPFINLDF